MTARTCLAYVASHDGRHVRADRAAGEILKNEADPEALLLRAAIRQGLGDEAGAWALLDTVPPPHRASTAAWFERPLPALRQLAQSPRFATWLKPEKTP